MALSESRQKETLDIKVKVDTTEIDSALRKCRAIKRTVRKNPKVLILQSQQVLPNDCIKAEEKRLEEGTGMKVRIINAGYSIVAVNNG